MPPETLRRFEAAELRRFLTAVDEHLTEPAEMILIGGSAIALHGVPAGTMDIDTWETDLSRLSHAIARAKIDTGLDIPVSDTGVADVPYDYRDRLQPVSGEWKRLTVFLPERHDLALSKAMRGHEGDLGAIEKLHARSALDLDTLVDRYLREMEHAIGDRSRLDHNIVLMVERIYGEMAAESVAERIRLHRDQRPRT